MQRGAIFVQPSAQSWPPPNQRLMGDFYPRATRYCIAACREQPRIGHSPDNVLSSRMYVLADHQLVDVCLAARVFGALARLCEAEQYAAHNRLQVRPEAGVDLLRAAGK